MLQRRHQLEAPPQPFILFQTRAEALLLLPLIPCPRNQRASDLPSGTRLALAPSARVRAPGAAREFHPLVEIMAAYSNYLVADMSQKLGVLRLVPAFVAATPLLCGVMKYRRTGMVAAGRFTLNLFNSKGRPQQVSSQFVVKCKDEIMPSLAPDLQGRTVHRSRHSCMRAAFSGQQGAPP